MNVIEQLRGAIGDDVVDWRAAFAQVDRFNDLAAITAPYVAHAVVATSKDQARPKRAIAAYNAWRERVLFSSVRQGHALTRAIIAEAARECTLVARVSAAGQAFEIAVYVAMPNGDRLWMIKMGRMPMPRAFRFRTDAAGALRDLHRHLGLPVAPEVLVGMLPRNVKVLTTEEVGGWLASLHNSSLSGDWAHFGVTP